MENKIWIPSSEVKDNLREARIKINKQELKIEEYLKKHKGDLVKRDKYIIPVSSGSQKGNMFLIVDKKTEEIWVLDVGASPSDIKSVFKKHKLKYSNVRNIVISHEHIDHYKSFEQFIKLLGWGARDSRIYRPDENIINSDIVKSFDVMHCDRDMVDIDNKSYLINKVLFLTDTGYLTYRYKSWVKRLLTKGLIDTIVMESNYCIHYQISHPNRFRPKYLRRNWSDKGHLSHKQVWEFIMELNDHSMSLNLPIIEPYVKNSGIRLYTTHLSATSSVKNCPFNLNVEVSEKWNKKI